MIWNSQAGQDAWVAARLPSGKTFLDIGASHPVQWSNTKALEDLGWLGYLVDNDTNACALCRVQRRSFVYEADATKIDYAKIVEENEIDYISLDIDYYTLAALRRVLECGIKFKLATVEHDAYRFGNELRSEERRLLLAAGYILERADVTNPDTPTMPFEDWWVARGI